MQHTTLYRKYRPKQFEDVVGQDHITTPIAQAIREGRHPHAYLLTGGRGLGKTSLARIIARAIGTSDTDTIEIDAASNRSVDDARELRKTITSLPLESRYRVYIIDEVHMLTKEAFNTLLKTFEEPPQHIIFILATTDLQKVPDTIVSRCELHIFKEPSLEILQGHVLSLSQQEGYTLDHAGALLIARLGKGSFRDTIGMLQKVLSGATTTSLSYTEIETLLGLPSHTHLLAVLDALAEGDAPRAFATLATLRGSYVSNDYLLDALLLRLRALLMIRFAPEQTELLIESCSSEELKELTAILKKDTKRVFTSQTLEHFLAMRTYVGFPGAPLLSVELALAKVFEAQKNAV